MVRLSPPWIGVQQAPPFSYRLDVASQLEGGNDHFLSQALQRVTASLAPHRLPALVHVLVAAWEQHQLLAPGSVEPTTWHWESLDQKPDQFPWALSDSLVGATKAALERAIASGHDNDLALTSRLAASPCPIVVRIAVHSLAYRQEVSPTAKLEVAARYGLFQQPSLFRELVPLGQGIIARNPSLAPQLVEVMAPGLAAAATEDAESKRRIRLEMGLLDSFSFLAPESEEIRTRLDQLAAAHPELSGMTSTNGPHFVEFEQAPPAAAARDLVDKAATAEDLAGLLEASRSADAASGPMRGDSFEATLGQIEEAAAQAPSLGICWLRDYVGPEDQGDVKVRLLAGLARAGLATDWWGEFVRLAPAVAAESQLAPWVVHVLVKVLEGREGTRPGAQVARQAVQLALALAAPIVQEPDFPALPVVTDASLTSDFATSLAHVWLLAIGRIAAAGQVDDTPEARDLLRTLIELRKKGYFSHVYLIANLRYLLGAVPDLTRGEIRPLFRWAQDPATAKHCFDGLMCFGPIDEGTLDLLGRDFARAIRSIRPDDVTQGSGERAVRRTADQLAEVYLFGRSAAAAKDHLRGLAGRLEIAREAIAQSSRRSFDRLAAASPAPSAKEWSTAISRLSEYLELRGKIAAPPTEHEWEALLASAGTAVANAPNRADAVLSAAEEIPSLDGATRYLDQKNLDTTAIDASFRARIAILALRGFQQVTLASPAFVGAARALAASPELSGTSLAQSLSDRLVEVRLP